MAKKRSRLRKLGVLVGAGLVAASVAQELRKQPEERTWQGDLAGIPYDYRPPTVERLKATYWAPEDERLIMPRAFGIGWDLNVGRAVKLVSGALEARRNGSAAA